MSPNLSDVYEKFVIRKLLWRLLPFLFLLYVVAYLDRINVGFAALQMRQQLGLSDQTYGLGAGLFFAGYLTFQVPSNLILQRVGAVSYTHLDVYKRQDPITASELDWIWVFVRSGPVTHKLIFSINSLPNLHSSPRCFAVCHQIGTYAATPGKDGPR